MSCLLPPRVRYFFCDHPACVRQIFTERFPTVVAPWARRTLRFVQHLSARLAACFQWQTGPDTLRRLVRAAPTPDGSTPEGLGVDAWAWRRGHRDGTIVV